MSAELLDLAARAARAAGELLLQRAGGPVSGVASKSSRTDLVSDTDRDAEALIVGMIAAEPKRRRSRTAGRIAGSRAAWRARWAAT